MDGYDAWLEDFQRRLVLHDRAVQALARDLASRTAWRVQARDAPGFPAPDPAARGRSPDVVCHRGDDATPLCLDVELPETLVRRETVSHLRGLSRGAGYDARVVLVSAPQEHERQIREARRLLRRAGIELPVAALAPEEETITGADW